MILYFVYTNALQVAEILMKRGFFEGVLVVRLVLRILCSRLGTFLLCGSLCLGNKWPYCNKFSRIPLEKREQVVQKWFRHSFLTPIRLGFIFIKFLCTLVFFSQVNLLILIQLSGWVALISSNIN